MTLRWRTREELRAYLDQVRAWEAKHTDAQVTALIHGRPVPGMPTLLERVRALRGGQ